MAGVILRGGGGRRTVIAMGRSNVTDYVGATTRTPVEQALELDDRRWGWQVKVDGEYARITLDGSGRIASVLSRTGARIAAAADLVGIAAGAPDSVLHGELEAHTEAGARAAAARGYALLHLFDATRYDGRDVSGAPYRERHGLLYTGQSLVEGDRRARVASYAVDAQGDAHSARTGRYCQAVPRDLRRLPVVATVRGRAAARELWHTAVEVGGGEGLVAVRLDAPAGARAAKRKVKLTDSLDCTVVVAEAAAIRVVWRGLSFGVPCSSPPPVGSVVEVAIDGWYESVTVPRFPRLVRRRRDLEPRA